jgi:hypothetical protein
MAHNNVTREAMENTSWSILIMPLMNPSLHLSNGLKGDSKQMNNKSMHDLEK